MSPRICPFLPLGPAPAQRSLPAHMPNARVYAAPALADSILDRLVHNAQRVQMQGASMGKKAAARSSRPRRFAPIATGIASESLTAIESGSVTTFIGISKKGLRNGFFNEPMIQYQSEMGRCKASLLDVQWDTVSLKKETPIEILSHYDNMS